MNNVKDVLQNLEGMQDVTPCDNKYQLKAVGYCLKRIHSVRLLEAYTELRAYYQNQSDTKNSCPKHMSVLINYVPRVSSCLMC